MKQQLKNINITLKTLWELLHNQLKMLSYDYKSIIFVKLLLLLLLLLLLILLILKLLIILLLLLLLCLFLALLHLLIHCKIIYRLCLSCWWFRSSIFNFHCSPNKSSSIIILNLWILSVTFNPITITFFVKFSSR